MNYTITELIWLFLVYAFLGWIIETVVGSVKTRKFTNRGFSTGPFCLVYGVSAAIMAVTLDDLINNTFFLFLGCGILSTVIEWITGKLLERLNSHKLWDYSKKKWNYDGYICLQYSILWAILGVISLRYGNRLFLAFFHLMPEPLFEILLWGVAVLILLDVSLSVTAALRIRKDMPSIIRVQQKVAVLTYRFGLAIVGYVERRMKKAYPIIMEKAEPIYREGKFAEGCGFYKLFWLFMITCVLGDLVETVFCRFFHGILDEQKQPGMGGLSALYGALLLCSPPFFCIKIRTSPGIIFSFSEPFWEGLTNMCAAFFQNLSSAKCSGTTANFPSILTEESICFSVFSGGIAAVIWIKFLYPKLSALIEKIPKIWGYLLTWIMLLFMAANILVSAAALIRYDQRAGGPAASGGWERIIDTHFDDERMGKIYPNAKPR